MASQAARPAASPGPASAGLRGSAAARLAVDFIGVLLLCAGGAELGLWFTPFVLGAVITAFRPRSRALVLTVAAGAVAGWAAAVWQMALEGLPAGATARSIAALAGLPPYAGVTIAVTLLLAALQALAGSWLARAVLPRQPVLSFPGRRARKTEQPGETGPPGGTGPPGRPEAAADPQA
jgi:hypothetical protein